MSGFLIENLLKDDDCHRRHKKIIGERDWLIETREPMLGYRAKSPLDETPSPVRDTHRTAYMFQHVYETEDYVMLLRTHHHEDHKTVRGAKISTMSEKDFSCQCEVCVCRICYEVYSGLKQRRSSPPLSMKSLPTSPVTTSPPPRYHPQKSAMSLAVHTKHFSRGMFLRYYFSHFLLCNHLLNHFFLN